MKKARGSRPTVLIVSLGYAEFSLRFAAALSRHCDVELVLNEVNFHRECDGIEPFWQNVNLKLVAPKDHLGVAMIILSAVLRRVDVLHFEEVQSKLLLPFAILARLAPKLVLRVHDPKPHSGRDSMLHPWIITGTKWIRRHANIVLLHGAYCSALFKTTCSTPVRQTTHGILLVPPPAHIQPSRKGYAMLGRMEAYKGLPVLTHAFKILHSRGAKFGLVVAGTGPDIDRLKPELELLPETTIIPRVLHSQEMIGIMQSARAVVLPYLDATQSGIVAAAFANGCPVIASNVGGLPDVVSNDVNGLLVPAGDADALAEAITRLENDDSLWQKLAAGAVHTANSELNWDIIVDDLSDVYGFKKPAYSPSQESIDAHAPN